LIPLSSDERLAVPSEPRTLGSASGPKLAQEVIAAAEERRARLSLGAAMNADDDRTLAGEPLRRLVEKPCDLAPIEAGPAHQSGLDQLRRDESAQLALGPARQLPGVSVDGIDIRGRTSGGESEPQHVFFRVPFDRRSPTEWHRSAGWRLPVSSR
jgi:hypothetical protein